MLRPLLVRPRLALTLGAASLLAVAGLGVAAFGDSAFGDSAFGGGAEGANGSGTPGQALVVERAPFAERLLLSGEIAAEDAVVFIGPNVGVWPLDLRYLAEDGTVVEAGEPVARFDNSKLTSDLESLYSRYDEATNSLASTIEQAEDQIAQAAFALTETRAQLAKAEVDAAVPPEVMAAQEAERRRLDLEKARLEVEAAEKALQAEREAGEASVRIAASKVATAQRAVERAEGDIAALSMEAPRRGLVLVGEDMQQGRPLRVGDSVFPGLEVARLPDLDSLIIEAKLFDVDDGRLAAKQRVFATLDAYPDRRLEGTVREVEAIAEQTGATSSRRTFRVVIDLADIDADWMLPGMSVKVEVADTPREALLVPRAALDFEPTAAGMAARVRLADGAWAEVELGPCDAHHCVVRDGLEVGTRLAPALEAS